MEKKKSNPSFHASSMLDDLYLEVEGILIDDKVEQQFFENVCDSIRVTYLPNHMEGKHPKVGLDRKVFHSHLTDFLFKNKEATC